jgi:hypothetical protein
MVRAGQWTLLLSNTVATEYEEILLREATMGEAAKAKVETVFNL